MSYCSLHNLPICDECGYCTSEAHDKTCKMPWRIAAKAKQKLEQKVDEAVSNKNHLPVAST